MPIDTLVSFVSTADAKVNYGPIANHFFRIIDVNKSFYTIREVAGVDLKPVGRILNVFHDEIKKVR